MLFGNQKLSIGGAAEKIVSAFHLVISENPNEDAEMSKCKSAVHQVRKLEKDVDSACTTGKNKLLFLLSHIFVLTRVVKLEIRFSCFTLHPLTNRQLSLAVISNILVS